MRIEIFKLRNDEDIPAHKKKFETNLCKKTNINSYQFLKFIFVVLSKLLQNRYDAGKYYALCNQNKKLFGKIQKCSNK